MALVYDTISDGSSYIVHTSTFQLYGRTFTIRYVNKGCTKSIAEFISGISVQLTDYETQGFVSTTLAITADYASRMSFNALGLEFYNNGTHSVYTGIVEKTVLFAALKAIVQRGVPKVTIICDVGSSIAGEFLVNLGLSQHSGNNAVMCIAEINNSSASGVLIANAKMLTGCLYMKKEQADKMYSSGKVVTASNPSQKADVCIPVFTGADEIFLMTPTEDSVSSSGVCMVAMYSLLLEDVMSKIPSMQCIYYRPIPSVLYIVAEFEVLQGIVKSIGVQFSCCNSQTFAGLLRAPSDNIERYMEKYGIEDNQRNSEITRLHSLFNTNTYEELEVAIVALL